MRAAGTVTLHGLRKTYAKATAVEELSLAVRAGEFLTLLGPSGSGKTTTLMMIAGFEDPDSGTIALDDEDVTFVPSHRRNIGVAFQSYALFPHMTVFGNVAFSLKMRDVARAEIARRVGEALELVQLGELHARYPAQLSGGQQQRVALARALVFQPAVLLLDEPLGALDRLLRERMQLELRRVHQQLGTTMIYVTHDQDEALVLSDRIAVMNRGRIEQIGSPAEIYERPASRFVAEFIGESNFLRGEIVAREGGFATVRIGPLQLLAPAETSFAPGTAVDLAIRPEKIAIAEAAGEERHEALVEDSLYVGQAVKYVVRLAGEVALVVKQQRLTGVPVFAKGDRIHIAWSRSDVRLFDAGGGSAGPAP